MTILFVGGEDLDFTFVGNSLAYSSNFVFVDTTAGRFRAGYARYGINFNTNGVGNGAPFNTNYMRAILPTPTTQFWFTGRVYAITGPSSGAAGLRIRDVNGLERLRIANTSTGTGGPYSVNTVNTVGTAVSLGNTLGGFSSSPTVADKLDVFINYVATATVNLVIYINGTLVFTYTGDITTNGITALSMIDMGAFTYVTGFGGGTPLAVWSEVIVSTVDTRALNLITQAASANGNTHNWDSGTASNIANNDMTVGDATPNYSLTAGQIQEYTVTPGLPAGNFSIVSVAHKFRGVTGVVGPSKVDDMIRVGGTDYASSDITMAPGYLTYVNFWNLNPNTGVAWSTADIVASSTAYNYGLKSVT